MSKEASSGLKFDNPKTKQVVSKILKYGEEKQKGSFKPLKGRSFLALGNPKHIGCVRGLGKRTI
jgi:hypothetical protein